MSVSVGARTNFLHLRIFSASNYLLRFGRIVITVAHYDFRWWWYASSYKSNISCWRHRYALTAKDNKRSRAYLSCKKNKYPNDNVVSISSALLLDSKIPQSANIPCIIGYNSKIFTQVLTRKRYVVAILCKFHKL